MFSGIWCHAGAAATAAASAAAGAASAAVTASSSVGADSPRNAPVSPALCTLGQQAASLRMIQQASVHSALHALSAGTANANAAASAVSAAAATANAAASAAASAGAVSTQMAMLNLDCHVCIQTARLLQSISANPSPDGRLILSFELDDGTLSCRAPADPNRSCSQGHSECRSDGRKCGAGQQHRRRRPGCR